MPAAHRSHCRGEALAGHRASEERDPRRSLVQQRWGRPERLPLLSPQFSLEKQFDNRSLFLGPISTPRRPVTLLQRQRVSQSPWDP